MFVFAFALSLRDFLPRLKFLTNNHCSSSINHSKHCHNDLNLGLFARLFITLLLVKMWFFINMGNSTITLLSKILFNGIRVTPFCLNSGEVKYNNIDHIVALILIDGSRPNTRMFLAYVKMFYVPGNRVHFNPLSLYL